MSGPQEELHRLDQAGLRRVLAPLESPPGVRVRRNGRDLWNFASNDYLGLASHPCLAAAWIDGIQRFGSGSTASRLVCGSQPPHHAFEESLAAAKHAQAALLFPAGFATAIGAIPAIVGKADFVVLDKLAHACLVDGARLSAAVLRIFPHNDVPKLTSLLGTLRKNSPSARILVVTESVFSMDGDLCPLPAIVDAVEAHGALLLLDEAHAFGVLGPSGMGLAEHHGLQDRIAFQMGTLSKAAGMAGGYLAASRPWIDLLINRARSFVFTTAPPPALAHAALAALNLIRSDDGTRRRLALRAAINAIAPDSPTPIIPIICGSNDAALAASAAMTDAGLLVPAIRYPTVPRGSARLRISLSAAHPPEALASLAAALLNPDPHQQS